jgi:predicted nucleic acid-binding Zn finger protein
MKYIKEEKGFLVQSESRPDKFYMVNLEMTSCNCPAFKYFTKGQPCKHIQAIKKEEIKDTEHIYTGQIKDAVEFVEKFGEQKLTYLKQMGDVFEDKGKLIWLR